MNYSVFIIHYLLFAMNYSVQTMNFTVSTMNIGCSLLLFSVCYEYYLINSLRSCSMCVSTSSSSVFIRRFLVSCVSSVRFCCCGGAVFSSVSAETLLRLPDTRPTGRSRTSASSSTFAGCWFVCLFSFSTFSSLLFFLSFFH